MLESFIAMVVQAHKEGVSVGVLKAQLLLQGMDEEECTLLVEIVAIEVRQPASVHVNRNPVTPKVVVETTGQVVDCYV